MTLRPYAIGAIAGAALTLALLWALEPEPVPEPAAPAATLPSGAVVAERVPDAPLPPVAREAARELQGETVRAGSVTIVPTVAPDDDRTAGPITQPGAPAPCLCRQEPIRLDWSLTRVDDGQRMTFVTDDGEIIEAVDIPVHSIVQRKKPWAAGASYSTEREWGGWVTRDAGPFVAGIHVENRHREGLTATAMVGIRF